VPNIIDVDFATREEIDALPEFIRSIIRPLGALLTVARCPTFYVEEPSNSG
jgi:hypothetical protein